MDTATVAWIGAITGIIGTVTAGIALVWDLYKWKTSRVEMKVQLFLQVQTEDGERQETPRGEFYGIEVINRSDKPTTITYMTLRYYENLYDRIIGKGVTHFIPKPIANMHALIGPNELWKAYFPREAYFSEKARAGYLYWKIRHSASDKQLSARIRF